MSDDITATCDTCGGLIHWIDCPTGGWWAHDIHPSDHHDAATRVYVESDEDAFGRSFGVRVHRPSVDDGVTYCGWSTGDGIVDGCGEVWPCSTARTCGAA